MNRLKRSWIVMANIALMIAMLVFIVLYSNYQKRENFRYQVEHFVNSTIAMERVTGNYLEGEQGICDNWAQYINSREMTLEEAAEYVRATHVNPTISAHLIDTETLDGLSTRPKLNTADDYAVSYKRLELLGDGSWIADLGTAINVSRTYTNPLNGEQSLAFCNRITVRDAESGEKRQAYLLRIVPTSDLKAKWVFPQEEYEDEDFSIIDTESNYVIKGRSFKNASFFEFYKSYNQTGVPAQQQLFSDILSGTGSFTMLDSKGRECVVAYTPITSTKGWVLLSSAPDTDLNTVTEDWLLIGVITFGLLLLLVLDYLYMHSFNKKLRAMAREAEAANNFYHVPRYPHADERDHRPDRDYRKEPGRQGSGVGKPAEDQPGRESPADADQRHPGYFQGGERKDHPESADLLPGGDRAEPDEPVPAHDQGEEHRIQFPHQPN